MQLEYPYPLHMHLRVHVPPGGADSSEQEGMQARLSLCRSRLVDRSCLEHLPHHRQVHVRCTITEGLQLPGEPMLLGPKF